MALTKMECNDEYIFVTCPGCDNCEQHPIDEQRWHLQSFNIIEWEHNDGNENDFSVMECQGCEEVFMIEWDYDNVIEAD